VPTSDGGDVGDLEQQPGLPAGLDVVGRLVRPQMDIAKREGADVGAGAVDGGLLHSGLGDLTGRAGAQRNGGGQSAGGQFEAVHTCLLLDFMF
jgi:hypothetical protein